MGVVPSHMGDMTVRSRQRDSKKPRADNRRVILGELFQSELFWRVIFMQIRLLKVMNSGSLQSQLSSNT